MHDPDHRSAVLASCLALALALGGCDTTDDPAPFDAGGAVDAGPVGPKPTPPRLSGVLPARGAWFALGDSVMVSGTVAATTAPIESVAVGGTEAERSGASFATTVEPVPGINLVGVRVESSDGERTVDGRAFFYGQVHPVGETIENALYMHLSPEFLDDDDPDPDDIAGVTEQIMSSPGALDGLNKPLDTEFATMTPTAIGLGGVAVDIDPVMGTAEPGAGDAKGELRLVLTITELHMEYDLVGKGLLEAFLTGPGLMDAEVAEVTLLVLLQMGDEGLEAKVTHASVDLSGFSVYSEKLPSLSEQEDLVAMLREYVEDEVEEMAASMIGELLVGFLESFAYDSTFGTDPAIDISVRLGGIRVATHGVNLDFDVTASTTIAPGIPFGPLAGSLKTPSTPPEDNFSTWPVAIVFDDDAINQLAFTLWFGGLLGGIDAAPADVPAADFSGLPEVFQPLSRVKMDTLLPPTLGPRTLDQDDYPYELNLGEFLLTFETETGKTFAMSINARAGLDLEQQDDGRIELRLDTRPKFVELQVGCYTVPEGFDAGNIAALMRIGIPPLLRELSDQVVFETPALPLDQLAPLESLKGKVIAFPELDSRIIGPEKNLFLLEGTPVLMDAPPSEEAPPVE